MPSLCASGRMTHGQRRATEDKVSRARSRVRAQAGAGATGESRSQRGAVGDSDFSSKLATMGAVRFYTIALWSKGIDGDPEVRPGTSGEEG